MKTESMRLCECGARLRVAHEIGPEAPPTRRSASVYRSVLVRAMAHAAPSAPARRSASITERHRAHALNPTLN